MFTAHICIRGEWNRRADKSTELQPPKLVVAVRHGVGRNRVRIFILDRSNLIWIVHSMKTEVYMLAVFLVMCSLIGSVSAQSAQARPITVALQATFLPLAIGQTQTVTVTVKNIANSTVQLTFLGLQFEWNKPDFFFVGGNSDKGAVLAAGEQIAYPILVQVPSNVTQGTYVLGTYVTYRWFNGGNWTGVLSGWWISHIPVAYPQTQPTAETQATAQTQTETQNQPVRQVGLMGVFSIETIVALFAIVGIGLILERGHLRRLVQKYRKPPAESTPAKPEMKKPTPEEEEV